MYMCTWSGLHSNIGNKDVDFRSCSSSLQVLSCDVYAEWVEERREAEVALEHREEKLFASALKIESQLELLG